MKQTKVNIFPLAATLLALSCSKVSFSGAGQGSRVKDNRVGSPEGSPACELSPAEVQVGGKSSVKVTASESAGDLKQVISVGDKKSERILTWVQGGLVPKDGATNEVAPDSPGTYRIELMGASGDSVLASCELKVNAQGGGGETPLAPPSDVPTNPAPPTSPLPEIPLPVCRADQKKIGTQIAFLIDNSNSNAATDCPNATKIGAFGGADLYECGQETNREKAVLSVFDLLKEFSAGEPVGSLAQSRIAVTSFPTQSEYVGGYKIETPFVALESSNRSQMQTALSFTRKPFGLTPYLAAMNSGELVMKEAVADTRSKVIVLVTDGEPTDRSPQSAAQKADALRRSGINIISVFYRGTATKAQRQAAHIAMMKRIDDAFADRSERHWYDLTQFTSFESYGAYITGDGNSPSLLERVSSLKDPTCQDSPGKICARKSYEVTNSEDLRRAFREIVATQAIGCGS
jgi:hypothetical protein